MTASNQIKISGAKTHNLKNVDVIIPRGRLTAITGPSGSGKSSLAIDTLFAEGQRQYMETVSGYARQFLDLLDKPDVDFIEGLSPAICVDQKRVRTGPRSTAGTLTDIYRLFRLLYAKCGHRRSLVSGEQLHAYTVQEIVDAIQALPKALKSSRLKIILSSPQPPLRQKELEATIDSIRNRGFSRIFINGSLFRLDDDIPPIQAEKITIFVVIDRLMLKPLSESGQKEVKRLTDSVELALKISEGILHVHLPEKTEPLSFHTRFFDKATNQYFDPLVPELFSFNTRQGACDACNGIGRLPDQYADCPQCGGYRLKACSQSVTVAGLSISDICSLELNHLYQWADSLIHQDPLNHLSRVFPEILKLPPIPSISDVLTPTEAKLAQPLLTEIKNRLKILMPLGLSHLPLNRSAQTLSSGEAQRLRIGAQIYGTLSGVLYVLDEPSIGLHQADMKPLIDILKRLCKKGNTCVVVEHDKSLISAADHIIEMGPGAGIAGGECLFQGPLKKLQNTQTQTARYLNTQNPLPKTLLTQGVASMNRHSVCPPSTETLSVFNATKHNLNNVSVQIPLGKLVVFTGVSGSGKSSLLFHVIKPAIKTLTDNPKSTLPYIKKLSGYPAINRLAVVDSTPIAKQSRANAATYTGLFSPIRSLFAATTDAKVRGYKAARFSFNKPGGRCEHCKGAGSISISSPLFSDIDTTCEHCRGQRFNRDTLMVRFKGKNIAEILGLSIEQANLFFRSFPAISSKLKVLCEVGLGYLPLGQPLSLLSGGENQRLKLASELSAQSDLHTLYLLDEPSTGLHFEDVKKLMLILYSLVSKGHSIFLIEHNLDIIACADWIIDLGPGPGRQGGKVIAEGPPHAICNNKSSITGKWLKQQFIK